MQLIPAIDILDGKVVRLRQGNYDRVTVWSEEPVKLALQYEQQGATRLHLVNLDGARDPHNQGAFLALVQELAARTSLEIQTGGGVRTLQDIQCLLDCGVSKVVVGTLLFRGTETVASAVQLFGSHRIAGGPRCSKRSDSSRGLGEKHRDIRAPGSAAGGRDRPR